MAEMSLQELLDQMRRSPTKTRKTTARFIGGVVEEGQPTFEQEELGFIDDDGAVRAVNAIETRRCSFSHILDQQNRLLATCRCGACTCSIPGCSVTCVRCGIACCRRCASVYADGETYCRRCRVWKWVRLFFDIPTGRAKP